MLTVLLSTRNQAPVLQRTLEAFCNLEEPPSGWKLVVVDNGSTDQTSAVLAAFAHRLPLHALFESKPGKNCALNSGLGLVEGDLTVFTDDDVFPHPDWLIQLRKVADTQPTYTIIGGAILPRWESPPPVWVQWVDQGATYALTDRFLTEGPMPTFSAYGPNMAIRTAVFQMGVRFDPTIGPRGSSYAMGSESELNMRLSQQGHTAWFARYAVVEHFIRDYQLSQGWVLERAIRFGRGRFRLGYAQKYWRYPCWYGVPRTFFRQILEEQNSVAKAWLGSNQQKQFLATWRRNFLWGHVIEAWLSHRDQAEWRTAGSQGDA